MRSAIIAAAAMCLLATAACQQTSVRGPGGEKITATAPSSLTIRRGESVPLEVGIDREKFNGPVTVSISQLPRGVEADRAVQTVETSTAVFALRASRNADLVSNQSVGLTVSAMDGRSALQYVSLTVTD